MVEAIKEDQNSRICPFEVVVGKSLRNGGLKKGKRGNKKKKEEKKREEKKTRSNNFGYVYVNKYPEVQFKLPGLPDL